MASKSRLLVYNNSANNNFEKFNELLSSVLQPGRYTVEAVTKDNLTLANLHNDCAALFVFDCQRDLLQDDAARDAVTKFVFTGSNPGKAMLFCDLSREDGTFNELWLLKSGFKDNRSVPDVLDLFRKFARREDIPINRQAVQLTGVESDDEFTVALARVENAVEYLCASSESGSEAIFVACPVDVALQQTKAVWSDLAVALNLDTVTVDPQPKTESLAASQETVLVFTGSHSDEEERFEKFDSVVKRVLAPNSLKYGHLNEVKLKSANTNLSKLCKALLLAPESSRDFDQDCRRILLTYFRHGGKMMFFGESATDPDWLWFLKSISGGSDFYESTKAVFDRFIRGERIPTNLQANSASGNEFPYSVAFFRVERVVPVLYLSCESGSTVAFAAASPESIIEQNVSVWKDLLRVLDVVVAPGQDHRFTVDRVISRIEDHSVRNKPPNLFVYNGQQEDTAEFEKFAQIFRQALCKDTYVVYPLPHRCISSLPWIPYCRTLFVSTEKSSQIQADVRKSLEAYFNQGGKLMFFCDLQSDPDALWLLKSTFVRDEPTLTKIRDAFRRFDSTGLMPTGLSGKQQADEAEYYLAMMRLENAVSVLYIGLGNGSVAAFAAGEPKKLLQQNLEVWKDMLRILDLDTSTNVQPAFSSGYLFCKDQESRNKIYDALKSNTESTPDILFVKISSVGPESPTFPLRLNEKHKDFDNDLFFKTLTTSKLGRAVVFIPVSRSVLATAVGVFNAVPESNVVVVGHQQPTGQSFVKRQWISPPGSALFSFVLNVAKDTPLGKRPNFAGCLTALAVVNAIKRSDTYTQITKIGSFPIGFKWPNDIYHRNDTKIGGFVTKILPSQSGYTIVIGIGINVSNQRPTACLNDFVPPGVPAFIVETLISGVLNEFETLLVQLQQNNGLTNILQSIEKLSLNINQEVTLYKTGKKGVVVGLDENGYLKVKLSNNETVPVTFDLDVPLRLNCFDCLIEASAAN